jgi:hypothetical protein
VSKGGNNIYLVLILFFTAGFFICPKNLQAQNDHIVINEVSCNENNDWVELYNPTNDSLDLSSNDLRLYKAKNSNPTLVMRIGNETDGSYSGQAIIPSKGYYLIVRDDAMDYFKNLADAIGTKDSFTWDCEWYTLYLGSDAITNDNDPDIIDKVGYGIANYFESERAFASDGEKSIERKKAGLDTDNNFNDFSVQDIPTPQNTLENIEFDHEESDDTEEENNNTDDEEDIPVEIPDYSNKIRFNEVVPNPKGKDKGQEFVEIYNYSDEEVSLNGWKLKDKKSEHKLDGIIKAKSYKAVYNTVSINNSDEEIKLLAPDDAEIDAISFSESKEDYSYSYFEGSWHWSKSKTPDKENTVNIEFGKSVRINEILPNPKKDEEKSEYIEIYNYGKKKINLEEWTLKDSPKSKGYVLPKKVLNSGEYWTIYRKNFKFTLNNSGSESVSLYNTEDELISTAKYIGSKENVSYNYDNGNWRWSRFLTPGKKNKLNHIPQITVAKDKKIYAKAYADFEVLGKDSDKDKLKFTWDFGDNHKSYKNIVRHKYEKPGKYAMTVKVFDGSEEVIKKFNIEVEKFPKYKNDLKIVSIVPNPAGKDGKAEYIKIKNNSKKKINLLNWSIATGSKNLYNHPITNKIMLGAGETKKITKDDSKFTLGNKQLKIELRSPIGEVVDEASYELEKAIEDDAVYEKIDGKWQWTNLRTNADLTPTNAEEMPINSMEMQANTEENTSTEEFQDDDNEENPQVLGAETVKGSESANTYYSILKKRGFFRNLILLINQKINSTIRLAMNFY